jgi:ABC-type nitrate/sulfonate/bicarbonate transport system ATPase subunit
VQDGSVLPAARVEHVSKVFFGSGRDAVWALADVSLAVAAGSFTCLIGPSGCGKSTLLRIVGQLEQPSTGTVSYAAGTARIPVAFVFQEHRLFPWLTLVDNVGFGLRMAGMARAERNAAAEHWITRVGLSDFGGAYPHQLSGGMRQRAAIARAFACGSPLLLMDEPLGALDAQTRMLMQEELTNLWESERQTVVLVTHSIDEALLLGDRVLVLSARPGRVIEDIVVDLPRPRSIEQERDPRFVELRQHIWSILRTEITSAGLAE